ncbi:hypothetical protein D8I35_03150 [Corticibacter populi]|uniref:Uncharacterized protein n=1 Tax=Corticibacter populi TaxID=1550736 RepID=A0A3M6QYP2_9BURK|nr:hypothetical protein [Corticibacter populi]RMX08135.1 hypothetical protein D8I35_03150 [Corticibacter populi]RZS35388.1 hypothetical protein EV687_0453 [Corticibacter populi]
MQIREQGRKIQFIRSTYDPGHKRSSGKVVATCLKYMTSLPAAEAEKLTEEERTQAEEFFKQREQEQTEFRRRYSTDGLPFSLQQVVQHIADGGEISPVQAEKMWQGMAALQKALKKAGHAKPVRPKKVKAASSLKA